MKQFLIIVMTWMLIMNVSAQSGEIYGSIIDEETKENASFANIGVYSNEVLIMSTSADENGFYTIKPIQVGIYTLKVSYAGYKLNVFTDVIVKEDAQTRKNLELKAGVDLPIVVISTLGNNVVDIDPIPTFTATQLENSPGTIDDIITTVPSVQYDESTREFHIRGARGDANRTYIDGVSVIGNADLPRSSIAQLRVITGGIPAKYGDLTGGVILITSKNYLSNARF